MAAAPSISNVQYALSNGSGSLIVFWNPDGGTTFTIQVTDTTAGTQTPYPNLTGFNTTLGATLNPQHACTIAIACTDGGSTGPYSTPVPILTGQPVVTLAQNQVSAVVVNWNAVSGYTGEYAVTLQTKGSSSNSQTTALLTWTFTPTSKLTGTTTTISVQQQNVYGGATSSGPTTTYTVITAAPILLLVDYSTGQNLVLTWQTLTGYANFNAYLQPQSGSPQSTPSTSTSATFTGPLGGGPYTAYVSATSPDGVSVGPPSIVYAVLTTAPTMSSVVTSGAGLTLTWQALNNATGYQAYQKVGSAKPVPAAAISTSYMFAGPLSTTSSTTCWVSASGGNGVVLGPASAVYTALVGKPAWVLLAYDATVMALTWTAVSDPTVTGYLVTVDGLSPETYPVGNETTTNITASLKARTSYPTTVCATNGIVQGPPSPSIVPLTVPPASVLLGYTGSALQLSWLASGESGVTGYQTELLSNGSSPENTTATQSPQAYLTHFASGIIFTARARCSGIATLGPWSTPSTGPYQSNLTYVFDSLGRAQSVTWAAGFVETYTFDSAGNLETLAYTTPP